MARTRTNIERPHILKTPFVIALVEYLNHMACKSDGVCSKAVSRLRAPHRRLAPIYHRWRHKLDIMHV